MTKATLVREAVWFVAIALAAAVAAGLLMAAGSCVVSGRAPSPSPGVPRATATPRADSEAAPVRSLADGSGKDAAPVEGAGLAPLDSYTPQPEPASTVTQSALTASPSATVYTVETQAALSNESASKGSGAELYQLVAESPWPPYLHRVVACLVARESGWNAGAVGLAGERGLLQLHPVTWAYLAQYGIAPDMLFDPAINIRAGYLLYLEAGGFGPWTPTRGGCA